MEVDAKVVEEKLEEREEEEKEVEDEEAEEVIKSNNPHLAGGEIWKSMGRIIPDIMENKKCLKPPTS